MPILPKMCICLNLSYWNQNVESLGRSPTLTNKILFLVLRNRIQFSKIIKFVLGMALFRILRALYRYQRNLFIFLKLSANFEIESMIRRF